MPDAAGGPALVAFAGLPGAGKTTLARGVEACLTELRSARSAW